MHEFQQSGGSKVTQMSISWNDMKRSAENKIRDQVFLPYRTPLLFAICMLFISCAGLVIIFKGRMNEMKVKVLIYFIGFLVLMQTVSTFSNIYGRYNLSKTCLTAGFFNVFIATSFFWALQFSGQALALATTVYKFPGKKFKFGAVNTKVPPILYVLLFIGWFILFARNFYAYKFISEPIRDFLFQKRTIGEFSFTIQSMLEFFLILYLSGLTSRIVSFFASRASNDPSTRKGGIGSRLLIIRITIVTVGLLLAFAALGIPMDRLTIILSALSVGIGFGLQGLVNNLVSGLIISIEKPVNVGDLVEVGGQSGTIKSIGFRSSVISTALGSDVIIPNGDLLNQHLVNWTHENNSRCVDIPVGVAYGTDLEKAIQILKELPAKDKRIVAVPTAIVLIRQFGSSSIDMQLSFWVRDLTEAAVVKSDILLAIDLAFKENGIEIPLPQQDLHIRSIANGETSKLESDDHKHA